MVEKAETTLRKSVGFAKQNPKKTAILGFLAAVAGAVPQVLPHFIHDPQMLYDVLSVVSTLGALLTGLRSSPIDE